jgi:hypothetical protein
VRWVAGWAEWPLPKLQFTDFAAAVKGAAGHWGQNPNGTVADKAI